MARFPMLKRFKIFNHCLCYRSNIQCLYPNATVDKVAVVKFRNQFICFITTEMQIELKISLNREIIVI